MFILIDLILLFLVFITSDWYTLARSCSFSDKWRNIFFFSFLFLFLDFFIIIIVIIFTVQSFFYRNSLYFIVFDRILVILFIDCVSSFSFYTPNNLIIFQAWIPWNQEDCANGRIVSFKEFVAFFFAVAAICFAAKVSVRKNTIEQMERWKKIRINAESVFF